MTEPLIEHFPCPASCSSIQQVFTHLIFMSAMWDRHFCYYSSFADQETEAGFANWPRVTCQGNGGAAIRSRAAWLQSHSLIHTRVVQENPKWRRYLVGKGSIPPHQGSRYRQGQSDVSGTYWKAFGLDQEGSWRDSEWTYQENNMLPTTWGDGPHRRTWKVLQSNHWFESGLSHHFCFSLVAV